MGEHGFILGIELMKAAWLGAWIGFGGCIDECGMIWSLDWDWDWVGYCNSGSGDGVFGNFGSSSSLGKYEPKKRKSKKKIEKKKSKKKVLSFHIHVPLWIIQMIFVP